MQKSRSAGYRIFTFLMTFFLFISLTVNAQENANYILTKTQISQTGKKINDYVFYDGLGRDYLKATNGINDEGKYIYRYNELTNEGLVSTEWLPITDNTTITNISLQDIRQKASIQYTDNRAFLCYGYDAIGRLYRKNNAGSDWESKETTNRYLTNTTNSIQKYTVESYNIQNNGFYNAGSLYGICTINEDGTKFTTYYDCFEKKILERRGNNNDTYYVYDDFDRLVFILMPEYQNNQNLDKHAFQYEYDLSGNITKKSIPGCEYIEYLYDNFDRCMAIQDGELRKKGLYRFMLYDKFGRLAIQGLSKTKPIDKHDAVVAYTCGANGFSNTDYTIPSGANLNITVETLEIINYYDNYSFLDGSNNELFYNLSNSTNSNVKGQVSGSIVATSNDEKIITVNSYDSQGNLVEQQAKSLDGIITKIQNTYSYTNKTLRFKASISNPKGESVEYDIQNGYSSRTDKHAYTTHRAKIGNTTINGFTISYLHDELGRISGISRPIYGDNKNLSYSYDIHGWIKEIRSNSYNEQLFYNDGNSTPLYSGNISSMVWNNANQNSKGYKFTYDSFERLTNAEYIENNILESLGTHDENFCYDNNGNITSIIRTGLMQDNNYGIIDNLNFTYNGNLLSSIEESAMPLFYTNSLDIKRSCTDILYNKNGALTCDGSRGITKIDYDFNNNPIRIQFDNGNVTRYIYATTGEKLRVLHYKAPENIHISAGNIYDNIDTEYLSVDTTDYLLNGKLVYYNHKPNKILFDEGYIDISYQIPFDSIMLPVTPPVSFHALTSSTNRWKDVIIQEQMHADIKFFNIDHLGNIREVINRNGDVCQRVDYYPSGLPFFDPSSTLNLNYQPYKYNGKEFDSMHGLNSYDYGARQYNPAIGRWDRVDPLAENYCHISPYNYCKGNPINAIDPDGRVVIFINGMHNGSGASSQYWRNFNSQVMKHFKDYNSLYYDGARGGTKGLGLGKWTVYDDPYMPYNTKMQVTNNIYSNLSALDRYNDGYNTGVNSVMNIISKLGEGEMIRIISHSMGGAFAKGFVQSLVDYISKHPEYSHMLGNIVEYDFAPFQPNQQSAVNGVPTFQYSHKWDLVAGNSPIPGAKQQDTSDEWSSGHSIADFMQYIQSLPTGKYKVINGQIVSQ